jgi:uncharacterized protein (DUF1330 family)
VVIGSPLRLLGVTLRAAGFLERDRRNHCLRRHFSSERKRKCSLFHLSEQFSSRAAFVPGKPLEISMVTVLAFVTVAEDAPEALAAYLNATDPLLRRAGARIVKRFSITDVVVGQSPARTVVMVSYPNREAVESVFDSPEYAAVTPLRNRAFKDYSITIVDDFSDQTASGFANS